MWRSLGSCSVQLPTLFLSCVRGSTFSQCFDEQWRNVTVYDTTSSLSESLERDSLVLSDYLSLVRVTRW